jgi:hypothetical protein
MKTQMIAIFVGTVLAVALRAANNPAPLVYEPLQPASVAPGGSGFTLTVEGTEFVSGAVVQWNGAALPTTFVSTTKLTASARALRSPLRRRPRSALYRLHSNQLEIRVVCINRSPRAIERPCC